MTGNVQGFKQLMTLDQIHNTLLDWYIAVQMQSDEDYPKKCEGLCDNPNFPQDWMVSMSCEGPQEESAIGASFFAAATEFDLQEVGLAGFALIGFASSIYLAIVMVQKLTNNKYQTITGNEMPAL